MPFLSTRGFGSARAFGFAGGGRPKAFYTFAANTTQTSINVSTLPGYVAGKTDISITVNSGVYVYSTTTATPALTISGGATGDVITLVNNGFIMGKGGLGSNGIVPTSGGWYAYPGGDAISLSTNIKITNNSYIGGGGGGGSGASGGGGAGGGGAGRWQNLAQVQGGAGATVPGTSGAGGGYLNNTSGYTQEFWGGGGGGLILPGVGGGGFGDNNTGGGAGGGGGSQRTKFGKCIGGVGGSAGGAGAIAIYNLANGGGGGGGWGAIGGSAIMFGSGGAYVAGGIGGKAIALNGFTATITVGSANIYGAIS